MAMAEIDTPPSNSTRTMRSRRDHYRVMVLMLLPVFLLLFVGGSVMALGESADFTLLFLALALPVFLLVEYLMEDAKPRILARPFIASHKWFHDGLKSVLQLIPIGFVVPLALTDFSAGLGEVLNYLSTTWGLVFGLAFLLGATGIIRRKG